MRGVGISGFLTTSIKSRRSVRSAKARTGTHRGANQSDSKEWGRCLSVLAGNRHRPKGEGDMTNEPLEVWEHRMATLLDRKLKPVTSKLRELDKNLLEDQRVIVELLIFDIANDCRRTVKDKKPDTESIFFERLTAKLTSANKELITSSDPISILIDFHDWCLGEQEQLGIEFIKLPD